MRRRLLRRRFLLVAFCLFMVYITGKYSILTSTHSTMLYNLPQLSGYGRPPIHPILHGAVNAIPVRNVHDVNCAAIVAGQQLEIDKAKESMKRENFTKIHKTIPDAEYLQRTRDCDTFKMSRGYFNYKTHIEDEDFPIAFSILLYKEVEQAERLLRAIYRPNNLYCLHVDADAVTVVHDAVDSIANCFPNVFVVPRKEYIIYSGFTRLQADLNCMEALLQRNVSWKYFINLPSQNFPTKTNNEMVKILKLYNGSNDIEGITGGRRLQNRFKFRYIYKSRGSNQKAALIKTKTLKDNPPYNITVVKGSAYGVFCRKFVEFVCRNRIARDLLDWFRDVSSPDEYYWATLHHNPHIGTPGSYTGKPEGKPWLAVYAGWGGVDKCAGKFVRGVCVFGVGDLPKLVNKKELFVNKFYVDYQPYGLDCIEEWHRNQSVIGADRLNMTFYQALPFIRK